MLGLVLRNDQFDRTIAELRPGAIAVAFKNRSFRGAAFGYFGHMWELYTLWAFVPLVLIRHNAVNQASINISLWSFAIIGIGALSCIAGGVWSTRVGSANVARTALVVSGVCCLLSPFLPHVATPVLLAILLIWGMAVIADSPQFSTLVARNAPEGLVGSALTIVNCIGFAITVVSLQMTTALVRHSDTSWFLLPLAVGPLLGLIGMRWLGSGLDSSST